MAIGYPYDRIPLSSERKEIRLLSFSDTDQIDKTKPLQCTLTQTSLLTDPVEEYYAISYTWGDATKRSQLIIDDTNVHVLENTESALRRLHRHKRLRTKGKQSEVDTSPVLLWIDSVCINQSDVDERNHQVAIMGDVYGRATEVLVPLTFDGDGDEAVSTINLVVDHYLRTAPRCLGPNPLLRNLEEWEDWDEMFHSHDFLWIVEHKRASQSSPMPSVPETREKEPRDTLCLSAAQLQLMKHVYSASWFERLWVVQEVVLAKQAICYCHEVSVPVDRLLLAAAWLSRDGRCWTNQIGSAYALYTVLSQSPTTSPSITRLLERAFDFETTEPRDKVFALLGLLKRNAHPTQYESLKPEYKRNVVDIYRDATRVAIVNDQTLRIIALCGTESVTVENANATPSWVPRYDLRREMNLYKRYGTYEARFVEPVILDHADPNVLALKGLSVDKVVAIDRGYPTNFESLWTVARALVANLRDIEPSLNQYLEAGITQASEYALPATLCCGSNYEGQSATADKAFLESFMHFRKESRSGFRASKLRKKMKPFLRAFFVYGRGRKLFITENGHIGMGLLSTQVGDHVCCLFGAPEAYVLREEGNFWRLGGHAYVYDFDKYLNNLDKDELERRTQVFAIR